MSTFDYKNYRVTIETDAAKYFPGQADAVRGLYSVWQPGDGPRGRQVYRGHTAKTFRTNEAADMIAVAEAEARAWIDANAGKPWA